MLKSRWIRGLAVGLAAFVFTLILFALNIFRPLEWKSWDLRLRLLAHPSEASQDIALILIDQESLDVYSKGQGISWPWPRQIYAALIQFCQQGRARAVIFDLIFSETSSWGAEDDETLSAVMADAGNVFLPVFLSRTAKESPEDFSSLLERFAILPDVEPQKAVFPMKSATLPVSSLLNAAAGVGNVRFSSDSDGIYRRIPLIFSLGPTVLPSLPLAVADFVMKKPVLPEVPLDGSGQMAVRYHGPVGTYKSYSAAAVINSYALLEEGKIPQISPKEMSGKIVLIGASAPGLYDLRPSPFSPVYPGVEVQASAIDNLLNKDFVHFPSALVTVLFIGLVSLLAGVLTSALKRIGLAGFVLLFCLALAAAAAVLAFLSGYWLEFAAPVFSVLFSFTAATLLNYSLEGRQRRFIKNVFSHYLSHEVIERVLKNPSLLTLGGEQREVTSFFSDVAGFTSISEGLTPENLVNLLNAYLSEMTEIILSTGGTLDKYEGDAIIAFWNAPLDQPDHTLWACRAALWCQERLAALSPDFQNRFGQGLSMRIGLNTGPAVVGNMGSSSRFDYTAMGDTVNLASRLEGACKLYCVSILIGENTHEKVRNTLLAREVDLIRVVGKKNPVRVYELIGEKENASRKALERIETFAKAVQAYRNRMWDEAVNIFQRMEDDRLARMYLERLKNLRESPPPLNWTGVYDLKEK